MRKQLILIAVQILSGAAFPDLNRGAVITAAAMAIVLLLDASVIAAYAEWR